MIVSTPEILWHGGANENGKPDPVFSVDMHPTGVFATAGVDDQLPPKGTVRVSYTYYIICIYSYLMFSIFLRNVIIFIPIYPFTLYCSCGC